MIDYKISSNEKYRYIFVIIDKFAKYTCCIPLKNKNSKTITDEFSNVLTKSKKNLLKLKLIDNQNGVTPFLSEFLKS